MLEIEALRTPLMGPVSLSVEAGACVAVLGPSGSGKSLLLRAVADLDPNEGAVRLDGEAREAMEADAWRRRVAFVPAESGWWADRVKEHFAPGAEPLLAALGLPDALDWEVSRLSTGERHRLALARALQIRPRALLLDEPTAALDAEATARVEALLAARGPAPLLLVTHDAAQADRLAARRYRMAGGRLERAS